MRFFVLAFALFFSVFVYADGHEGTGVVVKDAWTRSTPTARFAGAAYFSITNYNDADDALIGAHTPIAKRTEVHQTRANELGVMMMEEQKEVRLPKNVEVMFAPGGYHIMLMGLTQKLEAGLEYPLTLYFKNSPTQNVRVKIQPVNFKPKRSGDVLNDYKPSTEKILRK